MANIEYRVEKLSAKNYSTWKTVIKSHLMSKDLWEFVVESKNDSDEERVKNEQAKHLMYVSMEPHQIAATGVCQSAYDLWVKIKENHEGAEANLRSTSLAEFLGLKYRKNENLINYAGRYELALGKLESTHHKVDEQTKLWVFSNSLPQNMKQTVHMFCMAKSDPTVAELISQLKNQFHLDNEVAQDTTAFHMQEERNAAPYNNQNQSNKASRNRANQPAANQSVNQRTVTCSYCKKAGHLWKECRKLKADNDRKKKFSESNKSAQNGPKPGAFLANKHEFSEGKYTWIVDSGASSHMTPHKGFLTNYEAFDNPHTITLGNGKPLAAWGVGEMPFVSHGYTGELQRVLYVPKLCENLFSVGKTMQQNCDVEFKRTTVLFYRNNQVVLRGSKRSDSNYFLLQLKPVASSTKTAECALIGASLSEWHRRLAHCSVDTVRQMISSGAVTGMQISNDNRPDCQPCIMGKICRSHHPERDQIKASETSAVLHIDTVGPIKTPSLGGSHYFVLATEEYSGYKFIETVALKSSIDTRVQVMINRAELESGRTVKAINTDQGSEFTGNDLHRWLSKRGIVHLMSAKYTPQQNGRAERANRTILEGIRTLLNESRLPEELWSEAAHTVVYTTNRLLAKGTSKTRYELFRGSKPDVSNLHAFGQQAIIRLTDSAQRGKLAARGEKAVFVGYTDRHNTFRFYLEEPNPQVAETCDVRFLERMGPLINESDGHFITILDSCSNSSTDNSDEQSTSTETTGDSYATSYEDEDQDETIVEQPRGRRPMTRAYSKAQSVDSSDTEIDGPALVESDEAAMFTLDDEPRTTKDAQESDEWPNWQKAMDDEISALEKNRTWILVDKPDRVKPIKNKWVYKVKLKPDGEVERYKARLVAKGYTQIQNVDYKETYAPVASMNTVRLFLAIANRHSMHIVQFDVKTAFLYGDLDETLYMEQPEGYSKGDNKVCKLVKSLYGLKQAPRQWNKKFDSFLKLFKLNQASVDKCLYYNEDRSLLLAIYVDDGLAAGTDKRHLDSLIDHLKTNFELTVMNCESYLGFKISRDNKAKTLSISQAHYVDKMLNKFGMLDCKPADTPEQVGAKFDESPELPVEAKFKELAGSLLYLATCTRPDISHAVSIATRTSQPTQAHWNSLKRILRYLKGTRDLGICFRWENPTELIGYSDADYANDEQTRKSTTGICIYYGGAPIAWRCQRQPIITLSTTEAEYVAGCELVKELLPIREQLVELHEIKDDKPTTVFIDNQSTVRIAANEAGQSRTKHIDIRQKWLTEQVQKNKIAVKHISGDEQAADILTKPLYKSKFIANRSKLLTQIMTVMTVLSICLNPAQTRELREVDPISTTLSGYTYIKGDIRYKLSNIFLNPCERLFNYSTTITATEVLIKHCFEYYERKLLGSLPNCKRLPTIGPDLKTIPITYDCVGNHYSDDSSGNTNPGRCEVSKRSSRPGSALNLELDSVQTSWEAHKQRVKGMPHLSRDKRFIVGLVAGVSAFFSSISVGASYKTYKVAQNNDDKIEILANLTEIHTRILKEGTDFLDQFRESITAIHSWAQDVEERLGNEPYDSRLNRDPLYRGKKASLVKTYMQWFESQEKLLQDINWAASKKRIPASLKSMLTPDSNLDLASNWSNLFECSYRLENKSLVLNLDFSLPVIDDTIEILKVLAMDHYVYKIRADGKLEACWTKYQGPHHVIHNKTNGCITELYEERVHQMAVRAQTCLGDRNHLNTTGGDDDVWEDETCSSTPPLDEDRIQITEMNGAHKIYCHPYNIEIEGQTQPCPNSTFILEGHIGYKIANIHHQGGFIETQISRQVRSANDTIKARHLTRRRRSPIANATTPLPPPVETEKSQLEPDKPAAQTVMPRRGLAAALTNITARMNVTLGNIREHLKKLPGSLNFTKADFDSFIDEPFEALGRGFSSIGEYLKSIGSIFGIIGIVCAIILVMPALELMIVGIKIVKIPANLWLGSARRVVGKIKGASTIGPGTFKHPFAKRKKRWDDGYKGV